MSTTKNMFKNAYIWRSVYRMQNLDIVVTLSKMHLED